MIEQPFSLPSDFSGVVRLFPLPDLVVFPNNAVPLHIFESRYVEMLEDAIENDRLITMATLMPGYGNEYYGRPEIAPAVCISEVNTHKKTEEGTYDLMIVGLHRARVQHEIEPVRSFRKASVELIDDVDVSSKKESGKLGRQLIEELREVLPVAMELGRAFGKGDLSLAALIDVLSYVLPLPVAVKLELLAEPDVAGRGTQLLASVRAAAEHRKRRSSPDDFSLN